MILINGNTVTLTGLSQVDVISQIQIRNLTNRQFSGVAQEDGTVHLTFPMTIADRAEFAGHIHRHNAEILAKNPHLGPKGPGPKGGGPTGGSSGAGTVTKLLNTTAIAA